MRTYRACLLYCLVVGTVTVSADDWPEFRGKGRTGVWNETGIVEKFPATGLPVLWRTPINAGYAGPSVADGRVFVTDFAPSDRGGPPQGLTGASAMLAGSSSLRGSERVLALDEKSGRILWSRAWSAGYGSLAFNWATGPRATPTVDDNRVYVLGATGTLLCLDTRTGDVIWQKDFIKDYNADVPTWGFTGAPLVEGNLLICLVGGENNAKVVAFNKMTGTEVWRALPSNSEPGYAQPIIITAGGTRQLIIWHPEALASLDPGTGKVNWEQPMRITYGMTVATPVLSDQGLLVTSFYNGSMMVALDGTTPTSRVLWKGKSNSEIDTDGLHSTINTPIIQGGYIYGICSFGQFRALKAATGERVWETQAVTKERARWASGIMVRNGDRVFINNDRGELIIAKLTPTGFQEISRTQLIKPTSPPGNRRQLSFVNWSHPAYANKHIYVRNDEEIVALSAAIDGH